MWTIGPAFFAAVASGFACPSYATVLLKLTSTAYTPPTVAGGIVMQLLPCPYTPPTVI